MKNNRLLLSLALVLLVAAFALSLPSAAQQQPAGSNPPRVAVPQIDYVQRERTAPPAIKTRLADLRRDIQTNRRTFQVGYTLAMDIPLENLAGDVIPANIAQIAIRRNQQAEGLLNADKRAVAEYNKLHLGELPELRLTCSSAARAFDWRKLGKVTPVKDQRACGSCWAFATVAAMESSYLIRNRITTDESEQYVLANSGAGSCVSGDRTVANQFLVTTGTATEAVIPYTATSGPANPGVATPYDGVATGFVDATVDIPTVTQLKQALCEHGPLSVSVNATSAFQAYVSGVFNESANDRTNHAVLLIGWDDNKGAWLIKNSWGTGWGDTCGYGTERGYMWIAYNANRIGRRAQWIRAENIFLMRAAGRAFPPAR